MLFSDEVILLGVGAFLCAITIRALQKLMRRLWLHGGHVVGILRQVRVADIMAAYRPPPAPRPQRGAAWRTRRA